MLANVVELQTWASLFKGKMSCRSIVYNVDGIS